VLVIVLSALEGLDAQDERRKLIVEIIDTTPSWLAWLWRIPGVNSLCARMKSA
jgi:hypothetical protein